MLMHRPHPLHAQLELLDAIDVMLTQLPQLHELQRAAEQAYDANLVSVHRRRVAGRPGEHQG